MKKIIKISLALSAMALSYSCADELLDNSGTTGESQPTQFVTASQLAFGANTNSDIPTAFVNGMYAQMIQVGSGGSDSQADFGQKSHDIYGDITSGDMALTASNFRWYNRIAQLDATQNFIRGENRIIWRYYYRIIRSANTIIESLGGNDIVPEKAADKYAMGQAKAMRAHSFFYLAQYYQKEYNAAEAILPMPTAPGKNLPKSTAAEVYDLMEKDLTDAISLLDGFNRTAKNQVNKDIAQTIYAYVLGARGTDYPKMATMSQNAINSGNHAIKPISDLTDGFNDVTDNSWMWGIDIVAENSLGLVSWWGQIDAFSFSYGWAGDFKAMDLSLYNKIAANDARKGQFHGDATSGRYLQPLRKFYWDIDAANAFAYGSGPSTGLTADYVYMRIEEAYLLNAEANAKSGNDGAARTSLKAVMQNRIPDASYIDALSGQALQDEIYLQTRIELWGEGKSYLALKRNKANVNRGSNHLFLANESMMYNEEKMTFEIPQDEIQNNPFLNDQNQ
ncbi:RagB/SusD family nutrient uptake outer membrane protein [Tenacibaculum ovolyticum]|uniref:RagB/SusD family nutrient uptake outer membrane protein n=1 Tax=Tenacibaculum ovolyticum TaxID=104270 RepID=UPI000419DA3B|nr:RagB/SusD family nutrient uptake outer membrane protein [Tenacibaculum ovolyticum]